MREAILRAASQLYRSEGAKILSMRRVASEVGVAPNTIYRHFRNKEDLLHQIADEGRREFAHFLHTALAAPTPRGRFDASVDAYLDFAVERPDFYSALFMSRRDDIPTFPEAFRDRRPPTFQFLVDRVEECMRHGDFHHGDALDVALACWSQIHGFVALYLAGFFGGDVEVLRGTVRRSFDLMVAGLGSKR